MDRKQLHEKGFQVLVNMVPNCGARKLYKVRLQKGDDFVELECTQGALDSLDVLHKELVRRYCKLLKRNVV